MQDAQEQARSRYTYKNWGPKTPEVNHLSTAKREERLTHLKRKLADVDGEVKENQEKTKR